MFSILVAGVPPVKLSNMDYYTALGSCRVLLCVLSVAVRQLLLIAGLTDGRLVRARLPTRLLSLGSVTQTSYPAVSAWLLAGLASPWDPRHQDNNLIMSDPGHRHSTHIF